VLTLAVVSAVLIAALVLLLGTGPAVAWAQRAGYVPADDESRTTAVRFGRAVGLTLLGLFVYLVAGNWNLV
jgi:hypothetical protein